MTTDALAHGQRLRLTRDRCGDPIICGRHGEIADNCNGRLLASFHGQGLEPFSRTRASRIRETLRRGIGAARAGRRGL